MIPTPIAIITVNIDIANTITVTQSQVLGILP